MLKTLKITSFLAVGLAVVVILLPAVFGIRKDPKLERFLDSPGAVEQFKKAAADTEKASSTQASPLVKQAQQFALYLNPPATRPETVPRKSPVKPVRPRTAPVSSKFSLIGTCVYPNEPNMSFALIDQPGKGLRWVRQASKVGHSNIVQIKDGIVVVTDGKGTHEIKAPRKQRTNLLKSSSVPTTGSSPSATADAGLKVEKPPAVSREQPIDVGQEQQQKMMAQFLAELKAMQAEADTGREGVDSSEIQEFIAELESVRVTPKETEKLEDLAKQLQQKNQDPNRVEPQKETQKPKAIRPSPQRPRTRRGIRTRK